MVWHINQYTLYYIANQSIYSFLKKVFCLIKWVKSHYYLKCRIYTVQASKKVRVAHGTPSSYSLSADKFDINGLLNNSFPAKSVRILSLIKCERNWAESNLIFSVPPTHFFHKQKNTHLLFKYSVDINAHHWHDSCRHSLYILLLWLTSAVCCASR